MNLDGTLNEEEKLIRDTFDDFCRRHVEPENEKWNISGEFPREIMKAASGIALPSSLPTSAGGSGLNETVIGLLSEDMGRYEFPVPAFLTMHFAKLLPLVQDIELKESLIKQYLNGDLVICGAFTEPGAGSDAASISTDALKRGNWYVINGEKAFVSSPGIADAHILTVRTDAGEPRGHRGISLVVADAKTEGIEPYEMENMATVFKGDFGGLRLTGVKIPTGNLIGDENGGFSILMKILNIQRVHVALYSIGLAKRSLEEAIGYAKMRKTFGKPISRNQAVAFRLADDWSRLESVRLLAYRALAMQDSGIDNSAECAAVKSYGCEVAFDVSSHALQTFGASGYVRTSPLERRFRATRGLLIGDGTPDIQRLILSRKLFGREYAP